MRQTLFYNGMPVRVRVSCYQKSHNIYLGLICAQNAEPITNVTVNLGLDMPPFSAAIKDYSENEGMLSFLLDNELGDTTGERIKSGYVTLPVFAFDKEKLKSLDPIGCAYYVNR